MRDLVLETLEEKRRQLRADFEAQIRVLDEAIANIKKSRLAKNEIGSDKLPVVIPREYSGMGMAAALQAYLNKSKGGPISVARAAVDLALGGINMGNPERHERNLKICISNNRRLFVYDRDDNTVRLHRKSGG